MATLLNNGESELQEYFTSSKSPGERYTVAQVAAALDKAGGFVTYAATILKCSPKTVREYIKKYPQLKDLLDDIKEFHIDSSEIALLKKIKKGDNTAIIFHLKCLGKKRGFIDNAAIAINTEFDANRENWTDFVSRVFDDVEVPADCKVADGSGPEDTAG